MAQFCARVRKQPDLPAVSIKDIYQNPTISALAAALAPAEKAAAQVPVQERLAEVLVRRAGRRAGARWTPTSSRTWARTRWSWRSSAPACASSRTCRRVHQGHLPEPNDLGAGRGPGTGGRGGGAGAGAGAAGRGARRRAGHRAGPGGRRLLPGPGRGLAGHGEVLRPRAQAAGPAPGVHEGDLRQPEYLRPGGGPAGSPAAGQGGGTLAGRGLRAGDAGAHGRADLGVRHLRRPAGARLHRLLPARRPDRGRGVPVAVPGRRLGQPRLVDQGRASWRSTCGRSPTPRRRSC